jgi:cytidylate kinase
MDSNRLDSPLLKAEDAIEIDNSNLSQDEQFALIIDLVRKTKGQEQRN